MFDLAFSPYLKSVPPRVLPKVDQYVGTLAVKQQYARIRASHVTTQTYGTRLLTLLLDNSEVVYLDAGPDTWDRIDPEMTSFMRSLSRIIDPQQSGIVRNKLFVQSPTPCVEILYPALRDDPYGSLPIGKDYYDGWSDIQPLRLVEMTDSELTLQFQQDMIAFNSQGPVLAVFSLDIAAFVLKYLAYRLTLPDHVDRMFAIRSYIHSEVLLPCFINDTMALWLRNTYRHIFMDAAPQYHYVDNFWTTANNGSIGSEYNRSLTELLDLKTQIKNQSISIATALCSLPVSTFGSSMSDWFKTLRDSTQPPLQQQYYWLDGMRSFGWMEFIFSLAQYSGNTNEFISFKNRIRRDLQIWNGTNPWNNITDSFCKSYLKDRIATFTQVIDAP